MRDNTALYRIYREGVRVPENSADPVHRVNADQWEDIDWTDAGLPDDMAQAQAELATELHCLYLTHLTMLGDIVSNTPDMDMKRLAAILIDDRMRNVDAWGKYMAHADQSTQISDEMDEHAADLLSSDPLCQLAGMVLGDVFIVTLYNHLDDSDTVFNRMLRRDVEQALRNINVADEYLRRWHSTHDAAADKVSPRIAACVTWTEHYIETYHDLLCRAGLDPDAFVRRFRQNAQLFRDRITGHER